MKKIALLLFCMLFGSISAQENPKDLLGIPGPVEFNGTEMFLAWSKEQSKTLYRQQFMLPDERIEEFSQLLDFSYFTKEIDIELAVRQKVESVQKRQETDRYAKVNVTESPDGSEYIVDYYISEAPENGTSYVEYNIYRFKNIPKGNDKHFLILSYIKRELGDLRSANRNLSRQRDEMMSAMIEYKIPEIKIGAKTE